MKNLNVSKLFCLFILFFSLHSNAQRVIEANELNTNLLKETFNNAFIDVLETTENYIVIKNTYKTYLDIDKDKRYILVSNTYKLVNGTSKKDALELINKLNTDVALVKIFYTESSNTITFYYYFWTEGGFTQKSLIGSLRLYKLALDSSLQVDTAKLIM